MSARLNLRLPPGPEAAGLARDGLEPFADQLDPGLRENLRLLVTELVTNSVRHAGLGGSSQITLSIEIGRRTVRVVVLEPGPGFLPPTGPPEPGAEGGWGLYLVDQIADRWGVDQEDETQVWFELDR